MSLLGAIYAAYLADPILVGLLPRFRTGAVPARLRTGAVPDGTAPWGVVTRISNRAAHASGGTRVDATMVQFSVYAADVLTLEQILDRIKAVFVPTVALPIAGGTVIGFYLVDDRVVAEPRAATAAATYTFAGHLTYNALVSRPN